MRAAPRSQLVGRGRQLNRARVARNHGLKQRRRFGQFQRTIYRLGTALGRSRSINRKSSLNQAQDKQSHQSDWPKSPHLFLLETSESEKSAQHSPLESLTTSGTFKSLRLPQHQRPARVAEDGNGNFVPKWKKGEALNLLEIGFGRRCWRTADRHWAS